MSSAPLLVKSGATISYTCKFRDGFALIVVKSKMPLTNAQHQAAYRAKQAVHKELLIALAKSVSSELANSTTDKGRRLHAQAQAALNEVRP